MSCVNGGMPCDELMLMLMLMRAKDIATKVGLAYKAKLWRIWLVIGWLTFLDFLSRLVQSSVLQYALAPFQETQTLLRVGRHCGPRLTPLPVDARFRVHDQYSVDNLSYQSSQ